MKLRSKILLLLLSTLVLSLGVFALISHSVFKEDKILWSKEVLLKDTGRTSEALEIYSRQEKPNYSDVLTKASFYDWVLISSKGEILYTTLSEVKKKNLDIGSYVDSLKKQKMGSGIFYFENVIGEDHLVSYSSVKNSNMVLMALMPQSLLSRATKVLFTKTIFAFIGLVLFFSLIGYWFISAITSGLEKLKIEINKFSKGNFSIKSPVTTKDEIGELGQFLETTSRQLEKLIHQQNEKLKTDQEMDLARRVQIQLMPPAKFESDKIKLGGYYEAADMCGGDWWFYQDRGENFYLAIGDVTGHGFSSALLTSATSAAFTVLRSLSDMPIQSVVGILNQVIYETAKGQLQMTFCLVEINKITNHLKYCSASHEPIILIPKKDGVLKKNDLVFLSDTHGVRLGEKAGSVYTSSSEIAISDQTKIFMYSDGLYEIENEKQVRWGERRLIKTLCEMQSRSLAAPRFSEILSSEIKDYRGQQKLVDDLSFVYAEWKT
jgi:serine phosphatase RsbU (regulator of sigma subunit)